MPLIRIGLTAEYHSRINNLLEKINHQLRIPMYLYKQTYFSIGILHLDVLLYFKSCMHTGSSYSVKL
jgi:hypothetical protein